MAAVDKASSQKSQVHSKACTRENSWKHNPKRHTHRSRKDSKSPEDNNRQIQADREEHGLEKCVDQKSGKNSSENSRKVACVPRNDCNFSEQKKKEGKIEMMRTQFNTKYYFVLFDESIFVYIDTALRSHVVISHIENDLPASFPLPW